MKALVFGLMTCWATLLMAQDGAGTEGKPGAIGGTIRDAATGETIPSAYVFLVGTVHKTLTDFNGRYLFKNLDYGKYEVKASYSGYEAKSAMVEIINNQAIELDLSIGQKVTNKQEVVVKAKKPQGELKLELEKKNNVSVSDVISAAALQKTPDRSAGDALKRVSGASIQDNKFAIIRGLNDRYNAAYINDAPLPSSESDRKAFSFDIFPVNMLDNITILKTATPELPAEFAGGLIQIRTKDIPLKNFQSLSYGNGFNTITTFRDKMNYQGGKTDFLGMDDGTRALPGVIPAKDAFPSLLNGQADLAKQFTTDWGTTLSKFAPNTNLQYAMGINSTIKGREFGFIGSLSYNRTNNYNETMRRSYTANAAGGVGASQLENDLLDKVYSSQVLMGALANFSLKLNAGNSISFKNLYSINSDDRVIRRTGELNPLESNPSLLKSTALWFTGNNIYSSQLTGEHLFNKGRFRINWVGGYSNILRTVPNLRRSIYTRMKYLSDPSNPNPQDTMYIANISQSNVGPDYGGGMFFSTNKENISSFKLNLTYVLDTIAGIRTELKVGGLYQYRERDFAARQLGYTKYGISGGNVTFRNDLLYQDENSIFSAENMGLITPGIGGFKLTDGTKYSDSYHAQSTITAGYVSIDNRFNDKWRLNWGARAEYFTQELTSKRSDKSDLFINVKKMDVLPSFNLIYGMTKRQNLRFSGSQTLNRPEYREMAPFAFYDFNTQFVISGNDSLQRAKITNVDLRYEWFPGKNQLLSASLFYKHFENPIEQIARPDVLNEISYKNVGSAQNYGIELEFRSVLGSLFNRDSTSFWQNMTLFSNLAIIRSVVDVSQNIGTPYASRPLQGQSPYVFNGGIQFEDKKNMMSYTLNVNRVGNRIAILGSINQPDIWEKSRTFIDFQIAKSFLKEKLEVKVNFQNILAQKLDFYQNNYTTVADKSAAKRFTNSLFLGDADDKNGYDASQDDLIWSTKFGRTFSFSITYKF